MADKPGIVDQIFIALKLDTTDVEKNIKAATTTVTSGLKNLFTSVVAPTLAAVASGEFIRQVSGEIVQIDRLSRSLGINMEALQAWQGSAEEAGVATEEIGKFFTDLNNWIIDADFNQSGGLYEFIEKGLLPSVRDAKGELKSTEQYALELADALNGMDGQMASGIGKKIGIGNGDIVAWLQQGGSAINAQMEHIKKLGVYTKEDAKTAKDFTSAINELSRAGKMLFLPLFRLLAPVAKTVAEALSYLAQHIGLLMPILTAVAVVVGKEVAASLISAAKAAATFTKAFMLSPIGAVIAALAALGLLLDDFLTWMDGGESALGEFWQAIFGDVENAKKIFDSLKNGVALSWEGIKDAFRGGLDFVKNIVGLLVDSLKIFYNFLQFLKTGNSEAWASMLAAIDGFKDRIMGIIEAIKKTFSGLWQAIKSPLEAYVKLAAGFGGGVPARLALDNGGTNNNTSTDNSQHSTVINQTNNINGASDPQAVAAAVGDTTADIVANANVAYSG